MNSALLHGGDGSSWAGAFPDLHDALSIAVAGDEVWIAAGTYKPDRGTGDRLMSYLVPAGVTLYGGFAGFEECLDQRDWVANPTVLSGDLNGDDGARDCAAVSDCCREHDNPGCDDPLCMQLVCDGDPGCCQEGSDGIPAWESYYCARRAEAECCHLGNWRSCENAITIVVLGEGAETIRLDGLVVENAHYSGSMDWTVTDAPGAIRSAVGSQIVPELLVRRTVLRGNASLGIIGDRVVIEDSEIAGSYYALDVDASDLEIRRSRVHDSGLLRARSVALGEESLFERNSAGISVGSFEQSEVSIVRSRFHANRGSIDVMYGTAEIVDTTFSEDQGIDLWSSVALVDRCRFLGNAGTSISGSFSRSVVRNSIFVGSRFVWSPVYFSPDSQLFLENCSFFGNGDNLHPVPRAITLYGEDSHAEVRSCIFRADPADTFPPERHMLQIQSGATLNINHSIVEGWTGVWGGVGNSGVDPLFVDPDGADDVIGTEDDDLRLSPDSPAINAGDPDFTAPADQTDLDGHARVLCGRVDIGAYEFGIGDYDCNRAVDLTDFASWQSCMTGPNSPSLRACVPPCLRASASQSSIACEAFDYNADGAVDVFDFAGFANQFKSEAP